MIEKIKTAGKISGKTALKWIFIFLTGNLVTLITFFIALYGNIELAGAGHGSVIGLFLGLLMKNFFAFLLVFGAPGFLVLYFIVANKTSIQYAIYLLWKGEAGDFISSKVGEIVKKLTEKEGWRKEISDKAMLKAKILQIAKNNPDTSKLQRQVIKFAFEKIRLDDIDFKSENLKLSDILTIKFNNFIEQTTKPSLKLLWILILLQLILLIASVILQ